MEFWFDVVCPYAWIAATRIGWLEATTGVTVRWRPILLGGVFRAHGSPDVPANVLAPARVAHLADDIAASTARAGLTACTPPGHPRRTVEAMRLLTAAPEAVVPALALDLWDAYWSRGSDISDRAVLEALAARHGVDPARIDAPDVKDALRASTDEAVRAGVFGVPSFTRNGDPATLVWGADRMETLACQLGASVPQRLPVGPFELFHDFSSPYSYLGVATVLKAGSHVTLTPMLLGALFKQIGTPMLPIATFSAAKQAWVRKDLNEQAAWRGVPFRFTPHFPMNTVAALRVALIEPATTGPLYRGAWVDGVNLAVPEALVELLDQAGFDGKGLLEGTADPEVKARLAANTSRAVALGVPGAPAMLAQGRLFWGQDRLDRVAELESTHGVPLGAAERALAPG